MNIITFKWNPAFSSFSMFRALQGIIQANMRGTMPFDWSAWNWQNMHHGDRWFMIKVGYGATGIVATGTIQGEPYQGEDWSGRGRTTYYVDMHVDMFINPDALPILNSATLTARIPEYDWDRGHSGDVLPADVGTRLAALWHSFVDQNRDLLTEKADLNPRSNDKIFWHRSAR